ncbi:MAG TPA: polysaccharide biosynthesis tyrosine autokinase [Acidimicrobiales bacterium]|nr:polysaccharide biosynthesis tyrosine autokinase [Acidimicrobiales bacterium]
MPDAPTTSAATFDLRKFLEVLGRHWWIVVAATVAVVVPATAWSNSQTPRYRASAEMVLELKRSETLYAQGAGNSGSNDVQRSIATEAKRLESSAVSQAVAHKLGYHAGVRTSASGVDNVITVTAESTSPKRAADIANAYVDTYIQYRRNTALKDLLDAQTEIQAKIDEKQRAIDAIDAEVAAAPPADRPSLAQAKSFERSSLANQQSLFRSQVDQLQVSASLSGGGADVLTPALPPHEPYAPKVAQILVLSLVAGAMLGLVVAFASDFLDDSIRGEDDLERAQFGLPILGSIPVVKGWRRESAAKLVSLGDPSSAAAEGYRGLRTAMQFLAIDRPLRVVQVTSPAVSEGKSTTAANLAVALARAGRHVVVMCCDLRRPRVHEFFGISNDVGLTSVLMGEASLDQALQRPPGDGLPLEILASGPLPPNPSELLSGRHFAEVLALVRERADVVVVDSPPVLPVSDAAVLAGLVDATVLVIRPGRTRRRGVRMALAALGRVNATLVGIVLNGVRRAGSYGYGRDYRRREPSPARSGGSPRRGRGDARREASAPSHEANGRIDVAVPAQETVTSGDRERG